MATGDNAEMGGDDRSSGAMRESLPGEDPESSMESSSRRGPTIAHELYNLLRWFGMLRWVAAAALAGASIVGPWVGFTRLWPHLMAVALVVAAYNLYFYWALHRPSEEIQPFSRQRIHAIAEILFDLSSLLVAVHFTGGMCSPVLPFFVFHMAIGSMLLTTRTMYTIAAITCLSVFCLYLGESMGWLSHRPVHSSIPYSQRACDMSLLTLTVTLFAMVYLAGRVSRQFKRLNMQLSDATGQLQKKTSELEKVLNEIQDLELRKSHYMRISAHQLRSPLGTIKTSLQVLTRGFMDPTSERGQKLLTGTVNRVDALLAIVNDLLELAKIREGQANAPWTRNVDLGRLLAESVHAVQPVAQKRNIVVCTELDEHSILSWGVPPDIRFAFDNLVHNAVHYSHDRGEVLVSLKIEGECATILVADRGIGIPQSMQQDVFLEFVRAPSAKRHAPQGTGLGLSIVKEAVEMHGGSVSLESQEGQGTTLTLKLPLKNELPKGVIIKDSSF